MGWVGVEDGPLLLRLLLLPHRHVAEWTLRGRGNSIPRRRRKREKRDINKEFHATATTHPTRSGMRHLCDVGGRRET